MRFDDEHRDQFAVALLLRVLHIRMSTYYAWRARATAPCDRDTVDRALLSNIHEIWTASGRTYGADRVHQQLRRDGIRVGRKRVERPMAGQGWQGAFLRRGWRDGSTRQNPNHTPAPDLVNRNVTAPAPNRLWVADATRIRCGDGVFWLAAVRYAFSNRIVGWKAGDRCATDLILGAVEYGIWSRDVRDQCGRSRNCSSRRSSYPGIAGVASSRQAIGERELADKQMRPLTSSSLLLFPARSSRRSRTRRANYPRAPGFADGDDERPLGQLRERRHVRRLRGCGRSRTGRCR